jgi:hypothetical protein
MSPTLFLGLHDIAFLASLRADSEPLLTLKVSWKVSYLREEWIDLGVLK